MTNATNPTLFNLSILGGQVRVFIDQLTSLKNLQGTNGGGIGTVYQRFTNFVTGAANYQVPAATNLRIFGFDTIIINQTLGNAPTLAQVGYADDGAGTNFVLLYDFGAAFGYTSQTVNNILTGTLTVPTGKYPISKITCVGAGTQMIVKALTALETN